MRHPNRYGLPVPPLSLALLFWLAYLCSLATNIGGQSQNAIGAHRIFQKTSFSCTGRPAGYYADIETGCQVYHMCDGLGRQFSYSCPNTTLFQQRMLICDHWYMVNCSKAESDYAANLLIGQRDKPFVNDEENNLRTPRPDLLDRPYAPDYSGESFRNQYKQLSASTNQIRDDSQKHAEKADTHGNQFANGQTRWKIPPPSRTIQPPAYEPQIEMETGNAATPATFNRRQSSSTISTTTSTTTTRRPSGKITEKFSYAGFDNAALHPRKPVVYLASEHDDLGTSHSTRYNTSADLNSAEERPQKPANAHKPSNGNNAAKAVVKVPSKIYEPPFVYPIYNIDDLPLSTEKPLRVSTAAPFTAAAPNVRTTVLLSTTTRAPSRPTTVAGKPFTSNNIFTPPTAAANIGRNKNNLFPVYYQQNQHSDVTKQAKDARTPTPAQGFTPPTPRPPVQTSKTLKPPTTVTAHKPETFSTPAEQPPNDLLPPYMDFVLHDIATTQGPPIYYEWKVPSNGLEPPKLEPPIGVEGREYPTGTIDYNAVSSSGGFLTASADSGKDISKKTQPLANDNPFLKAAAATKSTTRVPTSRSIKETGQPNSVHKSTIADRAQRRSDTVVPADISEIRKELLVPEYAFPLESIGRTGYSSADTYNSFQLKIPERRSDIDEQQHWFGENPKCPECHPSFVVPGTCAPCLRR